MHTVANKADSMPTDISAVEKTLAGFWPSLLANLNMVVSMPNVSSTRHSAVNAYIFVIAPYSPP